MGEADIFLAHMNGGFTPELFSFRTLAPPRPRA